MKRRNVVAFGLSGLANNLVGTCVGVHLLMFYTDIVGLSPLWVSGGLVLATLWDAVSDVMMGRISDRTPWRAGRRRPFILLGMVPAGIAFAVLLAPPALEGHALGAFFVVALLVLFTAKTVVQVPALSLLPEMAKGYDERTKLATSRELLGNVGDLLGLMLPPIFLIAMGVDEHAANASEGARSAFGAAAAVGGCAKRGFWKTPEWRPYTGCTTTCRIPMPRWAIFIWLRRQESNLLPSCYDPDELPTAPPHDINIVPNTVI